MTQAWRLNVCTSLLPAKLPGRSLPFGTETLSLVVGTTKYAVAMGLSPVGTIVPIGTWGEAQG